MAYRMQTSVPELTDVSKEPKHVLDMYGPNARKPGTYAANCFAGPTFSRSAAYASSSSSIAAGTSTPACRSKSPASVAIPINPPAALIKDLKQRGLLDDTLVIWGGEFGRTVYCQGTLTATDYGRDHHPRCFTIWMAGGGIKGGTSYGATDDYCYNITEDPVPRARPARDGAALPGYRSHEADVQVPGPVLPADRRARQDCGRCAALRSLFVAAIEDSGAGWALAACPCR